METLNLQRYEQDKINNIDHVATPRWVVENIYNIIDIKSFALLLPLSTLETEKRANMYEHYQDKLSIIIFKKRIKFLGHKTSFNKACCWICYNIPALENKKNKLDIGW